AGTLSPTSPMSPPLLWTVASVLHANGSGGWHGFDPAIMQAFGTKVLPCVSQGRGGIYFIARDGRLGQAKKYTVRRFHPEDASIEAVGQVRRHRSAYRASLEAIWLASWDGSNTVEVIR